MFRAQMILARFFAESRHVSISNRLYTDTPVLKHPELARMEKAHEILRAFAFTVFRMKLAVSLAFPQKFGCRLEQSCKL